MTSLLENPQNIDLLGPYSCRTKAKTALQDESNSDNHHSRGISACQKDSSIPSLSSAYFFGVASFN